MARRSKIDGGARLRRLLQTIGRNDGPVIEPVKSVLARGADRLEQGIKFNIAAAGLVDTGALIDSVGKKKLSNGLRWKVGFFEKGNVRKWRRAGWRAHFAEWGTRDGQPAHHPVARATREQLPQVIAEVNAAVDAALKKAARR